MVWCVFIKYGVLFLLHGHFSVTQMISLAQKVSCMRANFACQGWFPPLPSKPLLVGTVVQAGPNLPIKTVPEPPGVQRDSPPVENCLLYLNPRNNRTLNQILR